eukprot:TRINITY_DN8964_c0_g1_i3.p1 TRINITY_DN8964_c0_g1~~TRINITY_DN8964_c0_g1_i3.p1  ORF type:complete len:430 (+),score=28.45 TRINITY_DN8964_c0_g1_i3:94-1383(+)
MWSSSEPDEKEQLLSSSNYHTIINISDHSFTSLTSPPEIFLNVLSFLDSTTIFREISHLNRPIASFIADQSRLYSILLARDFPPDPEENSALAPRGEISALIEAFRAFGSDSKMKYQDQMSQRLRELAEQREFEKKALRLRSLQRNDKYARWWLWLWPLAMFCAIMGTCILVPLRLDHTMNGSWLYYMLPVIVAACLTTCSVCCLCYLRRTDGFPFSPNVLNELDDARSPLYMITRSCLNEPARAVMAVCFGFFNIFLFVLLLALKVSEAIEVSWHIVFLFLHLASATVIGYALAIRNADSLGALIGLSPLMVLAALIHVKITTGSPAVYLVLLPIMIVQCCLSCLFCIEWRRKLVSAFCVLLLIFGPLTSFEVTMSLRDAGHSISYINILGPLAAYGLVVSCLICAMPCFPSYRRHRDRDHEIHDDAE